MATMDSCCQSKKQIFDSLRKRWVPATSEELVRQSLLMRMVGSLGYPKELITIEKEIGELPHLQGVKVPCRRMDILCFGKDIHPQFPLYPLLLIECKREQLDLGAKKQLLGYNCFVGARFIALAAKNEILFGYPSRGGFAFLSFLPSYAELIKRIYQL